MSSIFPSWANAVPAAVLAGLSVAGIGVVAGVWYYFTPAYWEVGYEPEQPIAFSHQLHAGTLGIDCRYCHTHVEESGHANVPDTATCMNCHSGEGEVAYLNTALWQAHRDLPDLVELRESWSTGEPVQWRRIHKLPDYAHFNHAVHVNAGVSCYSCHGRMDRLRVVRQEEPLSMAWCLECHRAPEQYLVDVDGLLGEPIRITNLAAVAAQLQAENQLERGLQLARERALDPPQDCGACHY
ncbi:MAG: cytochrome c3 family protein [Phycisphaerales bacterium]